MKTVKPQKSVKSAPKAPQLIDVLRKIPVKQGTDSHVHEATFTMKLNAWELFLLADGAYRNGCTIDEAAAACVQDRVCELSNGSFVIGETGPGPVTRLEVDPEVGAMVLEGARELNLNPSQYLLAVMTGKLGRLKVESEKIQKLIAANKEAA